MKQSYLLLAGSGKKLMTERDCVCESDRDMPKNTKKGTLFLKQLDCFLSHQINYAVDLTSHPQTVLVVTELKEGEGK